MHRASPSFVLLLAALAGCTPAPAPPDASDAAPDARDAAPADDADAAVDTDAPTPAAPPEVTLPEGVVRGRATAGYQEFLGIPYAAPLGAFHSAEVQFVFGHRAAAGRTRFAGDEATLNQAMMGYWTRFARGGDPNGEGAPAWPAYTVDAEPSLALDVHPAVVSHVRAEACAFWESLGFYDRAL